MPYLNHEDFRTVHAALEEMVLNRVPEELHEDDRALLEQAKTLMDKANEAVASQELRDLADTLYGDDETEIDDEGVGTSTGDGGVFVQAWVWVSDEEMALHDVDQDGLDECALGNHSWSDEIGKLPADTKCTRCDELYGDPD